jgi:hypothetical protein
MCPLRGDGPPRVGKSPEEIGAPASWPRRLPDHESNYIQAVGKANARVQEMIAARRCAATARGWPMPDTAWPSVRADRLATWNLRFPLMTGHLGGYHPHRVVDSKPTSRRVRSSNIGASPIEVGRANLIQRGVETPMKQAQHVSVSRPSTESGWGISLSTVIYMLTFVATASLMDDQHRN